MISKALTDYIAEHTSTEDPTLMELFRETHLKIMHPRMLSGHVQGVFLELISKMIKPSQILEIGTYTGYSALCLVKGLIPGGQLHTIEVNHELVDFAAKYFAKAKVSKEIFQHTGEALRIIPTLKQKFDLVFIDADKENYLNYYHQVMDKVRKGGVILADNALWDGKVINSKKRDKETAGIAEFNDYVQKDKRVTNVLVPLRDGMMMIQKI